MVVILELTLLSQEWVEEFDMFRQKTYFTFQRRQFLLVVYFTLTINKESETLSTEDLFVLSQPVLYKMYYTNGSYMLHYLK